MLIKSTAIVLKRTPYADNSAVVQLLTRSHGVLSFMVNGLHGKSGKTALYQHGNLVEVVFFLQANKNLHRIKEIRNYSIFAPALLNPIQQQILLFVVEIVQLSATEDFFDPNTFDYLSDFLAGLKANTNYGSVPILFLLEYCKLSGHAIDLKSPGPEYNFDIKSGFYKNATYTSGNQHYLNHTEMQMLLHPDGIKSVEYRQILLDKLALFTQTHVLHGKSIHSLSILRELNR